MQLHTKSRANSTKKGAIQPRTWDEAIVEAKRKLQSTLTRAKRLEAAIRTFTAHKERGLAWPGTQSDAHD
jgi:hypothetical protein